MAIPEQRIAPTTGLMEIGGSRDIRAWETFCGTGAPGMASDQSRSPLAIIVRVKLLDL